MKLELRPVERTLARGHRIVEPGRLHRIGKPLLGAVPHRILAGPHIRPRRQPHLDLVEAEIAIDAEQKLAEGDALRRDLVLAAEDMRIVLRHLPHAHQPVQRPMRLVAVAAAELGHAERQVAIGFDALLEDLHMRRAIHRLDCHQLGLAR